MLELAKAPPTLQRVLYMPNLLHGLCHRAPSANVDGRRESRNFLAELMPDWTCVPSVAQHIRNVAQLADLFRVLWHHCSQVVCCIVNIVKKTSDINRATEVCYKIILHCACSLEVVSASQVFLQRLLVDFPREE